MMKKILLSILVFIFTTLCLGLDNVIAQNFPSGWAYRREMQINNPSTIFDQKGYQVEFSTGTESYKINIASLVALGKVNPDYSDIRFADTSATLLNYWIYKTTAGIANTMYVNIPLLVIGSTRTIYMYYGNPSASAYENGDLTFDFFDDFDIDGPPDTTRWDLVGVSTDFIVTNGELKGMNTRTQIRSKDTFSYDTTNYIGVIQYVKAEVVSSAGSGVMVAGFFKSTGADCLGLEHRGAGDFCQNDGLHDSIGPEISDTGPFTISIEVSSPTYVYYTIFDLAAESSFSEGRNNTVSGENIALGTNYEYTNPGETCEAYWDFVLIRKYVSPAPAVVSVGTEEILIAKAVINPPEGGTVETNNSSIYIPPWAISKPATFVVEEVPVPSVSPLNPYVPILCYNFSATEVAPPNKVLHDLDKVATITLWCYSTDGVYVDGTMKQVRLSEAKEKLALAFWDGFIWNVITTNREVIGGNEIILTAKVNYLAQYGVVVIERAMSKLKVLYNPFTPYGPDSRFSRVQFIFDNVNGENVELKIYDIEARLVRRKNVMATSRMDWGGEDESGSIVESGAYIYQLKVGNKVIGKGIVVLAQ